LGNAWEVLGWFRLNFLAAPEQVPRRAFGLARNDKGYFEESLSARQGRALPGFSRIETRHQNFRRVLLMAA